MGLREKCQPKRLRVALKAPANRWGFLRLGGVMDHLSSCAIYNMPAYPASPCDCGYVDQAIDVEEHDGGMIVIDPLLDDWLEAA